MYSNLQFFNIPAFWLLLICLLELSLSRWVQGADTNHARNNQQSTEEGEFPHLLHLIEDTKRIHIVSESVHAGHRIQLEEYLDLSTFNQLIQFKWHEKPSDKNKLDRLKTFKSNILILNGKDQSVRYHYDPYRCTMTNLDEVDPDSIAASSFNKSSSNEIRDQVNKLADLSSSETSQSPSEAATLAMLSPYLTKLVPANGDKPAKWVSGIAGLWLKVQSDKKAPYHPSYVKGGVLTFMHGVWRFEQDNGLIVDFYLDKMAKFGRGGRDPETFDAPSLIVIKDRRSKFLQTINIFNIEFNYSNQLDKNLFTLPIGFNCPPNPLLTNSKGIYFRDQRSQLMEFELVATRFNVEPTPTRHQTDVKNIEMARAKHPMDPTGSLNMFRSIDDRNRIVQDNSYKLEYKIYTLGMSRHCEIEHLQFTEDASKNAGGKSAAPAKALSGPRLGSINRIPVEFNNGIHLDLSEFNMDFMLGLHEKDTKQMRLLNVFEVNDQKSELVFEADVPSELSELVTLDQAAAQLDSSRKYKMRIVRVYEQEVVKSKVDGTTKIKRGLVEFSRAIILVLNEQATEKLAEVRLNLLEDTHLMSMAKRAKLFDLSQCHDLEQESLKLIAYYPAEPELLQSVSDQGHEILDSFYRSSFDWVSGGGVVGSTTGLLTGGDDQNDPTTDLQVLQKRRLGASLNFLRVPKAEIKLSATGELELHLTILERSSPLDLFEHLPNCYFLGDDLHDQTVLVSSLKDCARHCIQFNCKVFAFEAGNQCKLSRLPLLTPQLNEAISSKSCPTGKSGQTGNGNGIGSNKQQLEPATDSQDNNNKSNELRPSFAKLTVNTKSDVYYEPEFITGRHIGEASLAEIHSYIEHISEELDEFMAANAIVAGMDTDEQGQGEAFTTRHKRSVSPLKQPLFVFDFLDRSNLRSDYAPPRKRLLVPSELTIEHMPWVLDVRAISQANRVGHTFPAKFIGKSYKLTALDVSHDGGSSAIATTIRDPDERVFRDSHLQCYYTLKRLASISQDNCALLCYNHEVVDLRNSSEQICDSFSYSRLEESCVLLIKTDFKFVNSILDLVQEGDIVHDIDSLDQLMVENFYSVITRRRYATRFEGPFPLGEKQVASLSTDPILDKEPARLEGLQFEWLKALELEGGQVEDDQGEQCAQMCNQRNRGSSLCLAFDHCYTKDLVAAGTKSASFSSKIRRQLRCNLLLINNKPEELRFKSKLSQLGWLRSYLARNTGSEEDDLKAGGDQLDQEQQQELDKRLVSCSRFLVSHLRDFNHLNKRQLNLNNELVARKLQKLSETSLDTDQDLCAMECGGLRPGDCLMFEFCQHRTSSNEIERRCTLYKRTGYRDGVESGGNSSEEDTTAGKNSTTNQVTSYHEGCHVYLRREFETIEQALSDQALEKIIARQPEQNRDFRHGFLTVCFSVIYFVLVVGFVGFCFVQLRWRRQRRQPPGHTQASAPNQPVSVIMMNEIKAK